MKESPSRPSRYLLGPALAPFIVLGLKLYWLAPTYGQGKALSSMLAVFAGDCGLILALSAAAHLLFFVRAAALRRVAGLLIALINIIYLIDTTLIAQFDARFQLQGLGPLAGDAGVVWATVASWNTALLLCFAAFNFISTLKPPRYAARTLMFAGLLGAVSFTMSSSGERPYSANGLLLQLRGDGRLADTFRYSELEVLGYKSTEQYRNRLSGFSSRKEKDNILLVIVESLSAADSYRTSGINDRLKRLDALSARGTLFSNFFANSGNSEGGEISLISGRLPLRFPGAPPGLYDAFASVPGLPGELHALGYHSEYLSSNPNAFMHRSAFLTGVGFNRVDDRVFFDRTVKAPHFTFDSPSDEVLYREVTARVGQLQGRAEPFFITAVTTSSHQPYVDPWGRGNTEENIWDYVDAQLESLVRQLDALNFFDRGILLVTGDHKKLKPPTAVESERYRSTRGWIVMLAIGRGVPRGKIDTRFFQQADLIPKLYTALETDAPLSPEVLYIFNHWERPRTPQMMPVFQAVEAGSSDRRPFEGQIDGDKVLWKAEVPASHVEIENYLNRERAVNQSFYRPTSAACEPEINAISSGSAGDDSRASLSFFNTTASAGDFSGLKQQPFFTTTAASFSIENLAALLPNSTRPFLAVLQGRFTSAADSAFWFRMVNGDVSCLYVDGKLVIQDGRIARFEPFPMEGSANIPPGRHSLEIRYRYDSGKPQTALFYTRGGPDNWEWAKLEPGSALSAAPAPPRP